MKILLLVAALASAETTRVQFVMGTPLEITADSAPAMEAAFAEVRRWDAVLSLYKKNSELFLLNRGAGNGPIPVSASLWEALLRADQLVRATKGAFDPAAPSGSRWNGVQLLLAERAVILSPGVSLDFGALGKGLALDHAARVIKENGAKAALLNFGGQVLVLGAPSEVQAAGRSERLLLHDASASTSGDNEKPGHIVSPFTGDAVRRRGEYTAVFPSAADADAWSTALYVLGRAPAGFKGCALIPGQAPSRGCERFLVPNDKKGASR